MPAGPRDRHAADRRRAHLDGAARHGDRRAWATRPGRFTGSQAGVITDSAHGTARIIDVTPGRIRERPRRGAHRHRRRLPGRQPRHARTSPPSAAAARTRPRSRSPRRWAPTSARSTPTSTASSPPTRASSPTPASSTAISLRGDARARRPAPRFCTLRCVEYARRYSIPIHVRSSFARTRAPGSSTRTRESTWKQPIITGVAHDRSEAKITVVGVPDKPGKAADDLQRIADDRRQHRHDRAERVGGDDGPSPTSPSRSPRPTGQKAMTALRRIKAEVGYDDAALRRPDRQDRPRRRRHEDAPRGLRQVLRRARRGRRQHRDDLDLRDPHLGSSTRPDRRRRRPRRAHGLRPRRRPRSRPSSTAAPADDGVERRHRRCDRPGRRRHAPDPRWSETSRLTRSGSSPPPARPARCCPSVDREITVEDASRPPTRPASTSRSSPPVPTTSRALAPRLRRRRRDRGRQLVGLSQGPRHPAGRHRGQPRRDADA